MQTAFRGRTLGLRESADEGIADVMVAVFDIPDTNNAVGNSQRQVIDQGAFRGWIDRTDFREDPVPMFIDHGDAMITGFATAAKKVGYADNFRETEAGLVYEAHYNLGTQRGREAWSDLKFDPAGTKFSFRWPPNEDLYDGADGFEHVRAFTSVMEVSQVGFGAQMQAGVMATTMRNGNTDLMLRPHHTETVDGFWDEKAQISGLKDDLEAVRSMYAWVQDDQMEFAHHVVGEDGVPGAASISAVRSAIEMLSSSESEPTEDQVGAYAHLSQHLEDSGQEVPDLRATGSPFGNKDVNAAAADSDEASEAGGESEAMELQNSISHMMVGHNLALSNDSTTEDLMERHATAHSDGMMSIMHEPDDFLLRESDEEIALRHPLHGDKIPPKPRTPVLKEWLKDEEFMNTLRGLVAPALEVNGPEDEEESEGGLTSELPDVPELSVEEAPVAVVEETVVTSEAGEVAEAVVEDVVEDLELVKASTEEVVNPPVVWFPAIPHMTNGTVTINGQPVTWNTDALTSGTITVTSDGTHEVVRSADEEVSVRAVSLDMLSSSVREEFMAAYPGTWVCDVYMDSGMTRGFVVAEGADSETMGYESSNCMKIPFVRNSEGAFEFDISMSEPVSKEWVDTEGNLLRTFLGSEVFVQMLKGLGKETIETVRSAIEEAEAPDPGVSFYRYLNSRRRTDNA